MIVLDLMSVNCISMFNSNTEYLIEEKKEFQQFQDVVVEFQSTERQSPTTIKLSVSS